MEILMETINKTMTLYFWSFCRIGAMFSAMPTMGSKVVPKRIRALLAVTLTVAVAPMLPQPESIPLFSFESYLIIGQQIIIGLAMGFVIVLFLQAFMMFGHLIGMQTSLGFAEMVDPSNGQQVAAVANTFYILAVLLFFIFDGHLTMIKMVFHSFETLPVGMSGLMPSDYKALVDWSSFIFSSGLSMALSGLVALLLINFSFGVMTRAAPQLNLFTIGFPITMLSGIFILWTVIANILDHYPRFWILGKQILCDITHQNCI